MIYKFNIRLKYSLFIILFTAILLISLSIFVFIKSRNLIIEETKKELESYSLATKTGIEKELNDSVLELRLLNSQFYQDYEFLPQFIKKYTLKYSSIELWDVDDHQKYVIQSYIVFGGDVEVVIDTIKVDNIPEYFTEEKEFKILSYDIRQGLRTLDVTIWPSNNTPYFLVAKISLDYLIEENIAFIINDPQINVFVLANENTIIYSKNLRDINCNFSDIYTSGLSKKFINHSITIKRPEFKMIYIKDITPELSANRKFVKNIALFVILIMCFILIIIGVIARRISESLINIREVATNVSEGDFSGKIKIHRNDELGALIDTFNSMVDKLDITFHELDSSNRQLQENIEELKATKNELSRKQKLALIGETVSKISHEIQNKMGGISIWIQNLELYPDSDETIKMYISEMKEALQSFLEMLNDFKMFYRQQNLVYSRSDIVDIVTKIVTFYENELKNRQIKVELDFDDNKRELDIDTEKIKEVITNIFINSLYYAPQNTKIIIVGHCENDRFILKIINYGPAIKEQDVDKIFQPFYSTKSGGSGLGLAISYNIIKAHKGNITIDNLVEGGVCTTIILPGISDENINS